MGIGIVEAVGKGFEAFGEFVEGVVGAIEPVKQLGQVVRDVRTIPEAFTRQPTIPLAGGPAFALPGGAPLPVSFGPTGVVGGLNGFGATPAFTAPGFDIPGFDVAPQGAASMFRQTASGNQVAQPFFVRRRSGRGEWFIPAGKPTRWSKANIRRPTHHHHPRQHRP